MVAIKSRRSVDSIEDQSKAIKNIASRDPERKDVGLAASAAAKLLDA